MLYIVYKVITSVGTSVHVVYVWWQWLWMLYIMYKVITSVKVVCRVTAEGEEKEKKLKKDKVKKTVKIAAEEEGGWEEVKGGAPSQLVSY